MLLSRVAERIYWAGRYLERAEATARLVSVHTELYLDLPKAAGLTWSPLLAVTGSAGTFHRNHSFASEDAVVAFLASDVDNPSSVVASITQARANLRATRALVPRPAWELLNDLYLTAMTTRAQAIERRTRIQWTEDVIRRCQAVAGALEGTMSHDEVYSFREIGRFVERADMTTRVLDVQASVLLGATQGLAPYADVTWMSVLRSLSALQMYLRTARCGVSGPDALRFLLRDPQFPRSVEHCLTEVTRALLELPRHDAPMFACAEMQRLLDTAEVDELAADGLHEYLDRLQVCLAELNDVVTATYFPIAPTDTETRPLVATA